MNIEQHVTSLSISKKLKELGVKQESLYYWVRGNSEYEPEFRVISDVRGNEVYNTFIEKYSAFLASELGELLPDWVYSQKWLNGINSYGIFTDMANEPKEYQPPKIIMSDCREANVRGMMLIYLLENNLLST